GQPESVAPAEPEAPEDSGPVEDREVSGASPEQEREAILRMISEGRITPEEGDMLLEALN
ncbi:MAG TPA: hypothetical protein VKX46_10700, partial [Ktedonobacteraceae bacterium]|nr:hypothetical protein [Ktedonobacteraceae bacterium]